MSSREQVLDQIASDILRQGEHWRQAVRSLESIDPATLLAVNPDLLETIDDACRSIAPSPNPAPFGSIRG